MEPKQEQDQGIPREMLLTQSNNSIKFPSIYKRTKEKPVLVRVSSFKRAVPIPCCVVESQLAFKAGQAEFFAFNGSSIVLRSLHLISKQNKQ